jgi:hypothetical protein
MSAPNKRMQPTALSRVLLLVASFVKVFFPVSSVVSAVRRLMRGPLCGASSRHLKSFVLSH